MDLNQYPLWTALVTPISENGSVDFVSLEKLVKQQVEAKNGLLILGSTAEALNLKLSDKKAILEKVISLKPASPIMVGVGGHQLEECLDWLKYLETLPIHAYLMVTPLYAKPGAHGQTEWFKALMDKVTRPVMLYNVPGRTAVAMSTEAVKNLNTHKNFWAIKEASGSVEKMKEYLAAAGGKKVYCGDDALMSEFAAAGAVGLVSVASNAWPKETHLYVEKCLDKTLKEKQMWADASNTLFIASNPVPVKRLLHLRGDITTAKMVPPLSDRDLQDNDKLLTADQQVKNWYGEYK